MKQHLPPRESLAYAPRYCEENIFRLIADHGLTGEQYHVLFISNPTRFVAMKQQRAACSHSVVYWDYHVVLLFCGEPSIIWDFDTRLPFPYGARAYLHKSFPPANSGNSAPFFRVIPAKHFMVQFHSDRSHMRDADGNYTAPPPPWPAIEPERGNWIGRLLDSGSEETVPFVSLYALLSLLPPE